MLNKKQKKFKFIRIVGKNPFSRKNKKWFMKRWIRLK
ncbi:hypothetical protein PATY110618_17285 [Paenibacillus typhae]|uniref:Uncharacterized protein n=1 Tax=Paenibacillus typhae TaxID=1174501 RepID=A0A1G8X282_9BACL|nr:hypothetical protein SAMN05216192_12564 [Paenibacillus typhae]